MSKINKINNEIYDEQRSIYNYFEELDSLSDLNKEQQVVSKVLNESCCANNKKCNQEFKLNEDINSDTFDTKLLEVLEIKDNATKFDTLFHVLNVPDTGKAPTLAGEIVRAYCKLVYRYFNDGDRFYLDIKDSINSYSSCAIAAAFLADIFPLKLGIANFLVKIATNDYSREQYEQSLTTLGEMISNIFREVISIKNNTEESKKDYEKYFINTNNLDYLDYSADIWDDYDYQSYDESEDEDEDGDFYEELTSNNKKSAKVSFDTTIKPHLKESLTQELDKIYKDLSKEFDDKYDFEALLYGPEGFMTLYYPKGFKDFAGDIVYNSKYWAEFENWLLTEHGINLEKERKETGYDDIFDESVDKNTLTEAEIKDFDINNLFVSPEFQRALDSCTFIDDNFEIIYEALDNHFDTNEFIDCEIIDYADDDEGLGADSRRLKFEVSFDKNLVVVSTQSLAEEVKECLEKDIPAIVKNADFITSRVEQAEDEEHLILEFELNVYLDTMDEDSFRTEYAEKEKRDADTANNQFEEEISVNKSLKESFAGWIAIYNGNKIEIGKDEADGIWNAKKLALKKLKVPNSKKYDLVIAPAYDEEDSDKDPISSAQFE